MERLRHRRSKSAGRAELKSAGLGFGFSIAPRERGNKPTETRRDVPSGSSFHSDRIAAKYDDPLTYDLGCNPSLRTSKIPIKKLLAEEMVKESEPKRRSPGIIARLMGLDGFPTQQSAHKQHKYPDHSQQRETPMVDHRNAISYESHGHHHQKSPKEHQEFKDVFEVTEMSRLQRTESRRCSEENTEFIQQKFRDAKRLSSDEKLQDSKEFCDVLEVLDSNKDLLLKFLEQPNCLYKKRNLKPGHPQSHCSNITVLKSRDHSNRKKKPREAETGKVSLYKVDKRSPHVSHDLAQDPDRSAFQSQSHNQLTRIVVLKPNVGKSKDASNCPSSSHSSGVSIPDYENHLETVNSKLWETCSWEEEDNKDPRPSPRLNCRDSRAIARDLTGRRIRRGYAGDESSSDSASESDSETSALKNNNAPSSTHSYVNREAKARLSAQWKNIQSSLDVGEAGRGSTLREMLSHCDGEGEMTRENSDAVNAEPAELFNPLGISSKDGWKDVCISSYSRSRSLPSSSSTSRSPQANTRWGARYEAMGLRRNKEIHRNFSRKVDVSSRSLLKPAYKKSQFSSESCKDRYYIQNQLKNDSEDTCSTGIETDAVPDSESRDQENQESMVLKTKPSSSGSPASSREIEQPSPVSVLEIPSVEDPPSGCESFERVSAEIQGLRMQLQLFKLESDADADAESPMLVSSDEDDGAHEGGDCQSSYVLDVLSYCSFDDASSSMVGVQEGDEWLIGAWVFHELESKYRHRTSWRRWERRLLFDRVREGLDEVLRRSSPGRVVGVAEEVGRVLAREENAAAEGEARWVDLRDGVDAIGREIEGQLVDELVGEVVVMWDDWLQG